MDIFILLKGKCNNYTDKQLLMDKSGQISDHDM